MEPNPYAPPHAEAWPAHGPPPPGKAAVIVQVVLLVALIALHSFLLLGVAAQLAQGIGPGPAFDQLSRESDPGLQNRAVGSLLAYFVFAAWGPLSVAWAAVNIVGVVRGARWSYRSLFAYWIANLVVCLCFPVGVVGLVHLILSRARLGARPARTVLIGVVPSAAACHVLWPCSAPSRRTSTRRRWPACAETCAPTWSRSRRPSRSRS